MTLTDAETSYSELLVDSKCVHWLVGGLLFKENSRRPGPFCIVLMALDLRGEKKTSKGSSNAPWKNELTSSFRRVRSHSETACCWAGKEEHIVHPFSATKGLRRHAEVFVVSEERTRAWKPGTYNPQWCPPEGGTYISLFCLTDQWLLLPQTEQERSESCTQKCYLSLTTEDLRLGMGIRKLTMISKIRLDNKPTETSNSREG